MSTAAEPLAAHIFATDRRRSDRSELALDTLMSDRMGQVFGVRILNLSEHGFMATTEIGLCERAPVRVDLPMIGWMRADIMWALGDKVGAAFREPIDPAILTAFVGNYGD